MAHSLGITLCVVAWGYLVSAAIDFGTSARDGESNAWLFLALACLGAAACLFVGLILGTRMLQDLGIMASAQPTRPDEDKAPDDGPGPVWPPEAPAPPDQPADGSSPPTYQGRRIAR